MSKKFLRSDTTRHVRIGKNRPKLQKWRKPRGRHNKIRRNRAGYPSMPTVGHRTSKALSGLVDGKKPFHVQNMNDLQKAGKDNLVIIARKIGAKKRVEIIKKAKEMKLHLANVSEGSQ